LDVACLAAGFVAGFLAAGFRTPEFLAVTGFAFVSRAAVSLAVSFFALAAAVDFPAMALVVAGLRAGERDEVAFCFAAVRFAPEPADRADFGFVSLAAFEGETFTRPRMAGPDDRILAAAFAVARRIDLLCKVEAMGTALVTVVTR
jgi:hypothetical protein